MRVLMCEPKYFKIGADDPHLNPWMDSTKQPDKELALKQWGELKSFMIKNMIEVYLLKSQKDLFDQVFTANIAWGINGKFVMASLKPPWRREEIKYAAQWFIEHGFNVNHLPEDLYFEGQGDIVSVGDCGFLYCCGIRNDARIIDKIPKILKLDKPLIPLKLIDNRFYHGDLCLRYSKKRHAILYNPSAFDAQSLRMIERLTIKKKEAPEALWLQKTEGGYNFPLNGCYVHDAETFPWDEKVGAFPENIKQWIEDDGGKVWLHNFDQFGLSGAGHRCVTLFLD